MAVPNVRLVWVPCRNPWATLSQKYASAFNDVNDDLFMVDELDGMTYQVFRLGPQNLDEEAWAINQTVTHTFFDDKTETQRAKHRGLWFPVQMTETPSDTADEWLLCKLAAMKRLVDQIDELIVADDADAYDTDDTRTLYGGTDTNCSSVADNAAADTKAS